MEQKFGKRPLSYRQVEQKALRDRLENAGIKTWRITKTRNQVAQLLWIACNRLNPETPAAAYQMLVMLNQRYSNGAKQQLGYAKYVGIDKDRSALLQREGDYSNEMTKEGLRQWMSKEVRRENRPIDVPPRTSKSHMDTHVPTETSVSG